MNDLLEIIHALAEISPVAWIALVAIAAMSVVAFSVWLHRKP